MLKSFMVETSEIIKLDKLKFEPYFSEEEIKAAVLNVADEINKDYQGEEILLIGVLNGAFVFLNELIKHLSVRLEVDFIKVSSYDGLTSKGELELSLDFRNDIAGKHVILVEDIIDSGLTAFRLMKMAKCLRPKSLRIASLLIKPECIQTEINFDYVGIEIPDVFVVGYGMDYNQKGRELPAIYKLAN